MFMNSLRWRRIVLVLSLALSVWAFGPAGSANASIIMELDIEFSGGTDPAGATPWLTATFDDSVGPGVRLTMDASGLVDVEFASEWSFNLDPALTPADLVFTAVNNADSVPNSISTGVDAFQADGDGKFDILFDFPPPPGAFAAKFTTGETVVYDITYTGLGTFDENSFDFFSAPGGGQGTFRAAAHVQGIGPTGEDSGWIGDDGGGPGNGEPIIPEAASLIVWSVLISCSGMAIARRRRSETN